MNLWRIGIDEESGEALGQPEPMTTPSPAVGNIAVSSDGRRIVYESRQRRTQMQKLGFDPSELAIVGSPEPVRPGNRPWGGPHPSPNEEWVAFQASAPQEDIYIIRKDGSDLRLLTDDPYNDRAPLWSPNGDRIAFFSNRSGKYEVWSIRPDGSGLEQITNTPTGPSYLLPTWFPDGKRMTCSSDSGTHFIDLTKPLGNRLSPALPFLSDEGNRFWTYSISPDGLWLAGGARHVEGRLLPGIIVYSMQDKTFQKITDLGRTPGGWLSDNRRLLFSHDNMLFIIDRISRQQQKLIEFSSNTLVLSPRLSRDNRTIYFTTFGTGIDLWLAKIKEPAQK
jgi:Tol biopolymer transport system component